MAFTTEMYRQRKADGLCPMCGHRPPSKTRAWCAECREKENTRNLQSGRGPKRNGYMAEYRQRIRREVINAYGGACAQCGVADIRCLQLDHVNGGGSAHRNEVMGTKNTAGIGFYAKMRQQGYPPGLQVLCANCHMIKTYRA